MPTFTPELVFGPYVSGMQADGAENYRTILRDAPTLFLNFLSGGLSPLVTFTRASSATQTNSSGVLELVGNNIPRFDYNPTTLVRNGLFIEGQSTNELLNSLLDGTPLSTQTPTVTAVSYALSFYGTGSIALSGAFIGTLNGSGVYPARVSLIFTPIAGPLVLTVTGSVQYAQLELGLVVTSFIPTAGVTATRASELYEIAGANFTSWFNPVEGTFVVNKLDGVGGSSGSDPGGIFTVNDGSSSNRMDLRAFTGQSFTTVAGVTQANPTSGATSPGKYAFGYKLNDFGLSRDGTAALTDTSGTVPVVNKLGIGLLDTGISCLNGHLTSLVYYPIKKSTSELEVLSLP